MTCQVRFSSWTPLWLAAVVWLACGGQAHAAPAKVDYNRDIRPILSENCFACHGFDEKARKAKLRLDIPHTDGPFELRGTTPLVPGHPDASEVWRRITASDPDDLMPPPDSHHTLTDAQKQMIRAWIEQGAAYAGHWSFIAPVRPEVPGAVPGAGAGHPVDAFIHARLESEGLRPAAEADRRTLIRRLSLDLTGLTPSAAEVEAFVNDRDPKAYENLVERLLASPHFGERMALPWLDAARYADTNGFSIDGGRHMWLWRDWVIQAFNDNKPYDQFLIEQLAGDLLPERTDGQLIASGFQRNNMVTHEGGTIPEENLTNYNADRVKTLGEAVLGLTLGCAQCHDHKYDPVTQKDYYQLFAFFNTLNDRGLDGNAGVNPGPSIMAKTVLETDDLPRVKKRIAAIESQLATPNPRNPRILQAWERQQLRLLARRGKGLAVHPVKVLKISTPNRGGGSSIEPDGRVRFESSRGLIAFDLSTQLPAVDRPITGVRVTAYPQADLPGGGWGEGKLTDDDAKGSDNDAASTRGTFVLTAMCATADTIPNDQVNTYKLMGVRRVTASSWLADMPASACLDPRNDSGWSPDPAADGPVHLTMSFAEPVHASQTPYLTVQLNFGYGKSLVPALVEVAVITGEDDGTDLPDAVVKALQTPADQRTPEMAAALWAHCAAHGDALAARRIELANLKERVAVLTEKFPTMVMDVAEKPRDTFILNRGDYSQPGAKVTAGTPAALPPMPEGAPANRLGLAQWVTRPDHPLTARVAVNRLWSQFFGTGIVATLADFGAQGEFPSHPDLLDYLAVDFMESGWNVKQLVRLIVTSQTYKQSSDTPADVLERDPENRLLARGPRFRLPAELVRDNALKISGLLVPRIGGPSVNPYTPGDLWREVSHYGSSPATAQVFVQDHGEKLYRRSLYTYWKRTQPPPNMLAFDAPNREVCTITRGNTTTPMQALVLLNDAQFVEAARAFAERMLHEPGDDAARLRWGFYEAVARPPSAKELIILRTALARERQRYRDDPSAASAALAVGESPRDRRIDAAEHAAWMQVAGVILNLSETITRR